MADTPLPIDGASFLLLQGMLLRLERLENQTNVALVRIERNQEKLMAISQDILALVQKVDAATNAIADRIQKLIDQLSGGVSAADAEAIQAGLQAEVDRLTALGQDPANPVPQG